MRSSNVFRATMLIVLSITVLQFASAASTGTSSLSVPNSTTLYISNLNVSIPFSVNLASGTPGTIYLLLNNTQSLQKANLYVRFNPGSGIPPFSGNMIVSTSNTNPATPGKYNIQMTAFGADPLSPTVINISLVVAEKPNSATTITQQSTTVLPTTSSINQQNNNGYSAVDLFVVAVVIAVVIVLFLVAYGLVRK